MTSTAPAAKGQRILFACASREYTAADVIDAAHFRGELTGPWQALQAARAAERKAEASGAEPEAGAIDQAAVEFRYRHELITAEETERWLEERALDLGDFSNFFARNYWQRNLAGKMAAESRPYAEANADERELLVAHLVLTGELERMALALAWRVAAPGEANDAERAEQQEQFLARHELSEDAVEDWLAALGRDRAWLEEMMALEAAYRARCAQLLRPEAIERELGAVRLPMTRFEVEMIELESKDAASEALFCVRDDGMSMEEVAREGRYPFRQTGMTLEQIAPDLQQRFLSLTPGSLLEPTPRADGFVLCRLLGKHEPQASDPPVRARIEQRLLERHFADLTANQVQWRLLPTVSAA